MPTVSQTARTKARFLDVFRLCGNVTESAARTGTTRRNVYHWIERDKRFKAAFDDAELEAADHLEAEAWRRAVEGTTRLKFYEGRMIMVADPAEDDPGRTVPYIEREYSDGLMIQLLKAHKPQKYRERTTHEFDDGGPPLRIVIDHGNHGSP